MTTKGETSASLLARLRRNMGVLLTGSAATSVLGVLTLALNARALEPALLGVLALVQAYVVVLGRVFSFDTWQALIRFGAAAETRGDLGELRALATFAALFDAASALAAGVAGLVILYVFSGAIGFPERYLPAVAFYTASLFLQLPGAPIGVMRLFNKFGWITSIAVAESAGRLVAAAALFAMDAPLEAYLYAFGGILVAGNLTRIAAALRLFRARIGSLAPATIAQMRPVARRFVSFSAGSWLTGTLNVTRRDGTLMVVGALLGPAAAGYFAVAQRLVTPLREVADMLRQALFPDLSRLVAAGEHDKVFGVMKRVLLFTIPVAAGTVVGAILLGEIAIRIVAGADYLQAYWVLVGLAAAVGLYLCAPPLSALVILYAGMRRYTLATTAAFVVWAVVFPVPMLMWGINGAAVGEVVFVAAWLLFNGILFRRWWARRRTEPPAEPV